MNRAGRPCRVLAQVWNNGGSQAGALEATLTLPGIAGIILTIGMAVDSNVLIFERIREEMRTGKSISIDSTGVFIAFEHPVLTASAPSDVRLPPMPPL